MDTKKKKRKRRCLVYGTLAGGIFVLSLAGCFERLAFVPSPGPPLQTPSQLGWTKWRNVRFSSDDDKTLHGWIISGRKEPGETPKAIVVHAHGNAGNMGNHLIPAVSHCLSYGCDVLMFDYRSYGQSDPGGLDRYSVVKDLAGAIDWAKKEYPRSKLLLLGQSMGGATTALYAAKRPVASHIDGMCLISAFADWNTEVCDELKSNPVTWLFAYPLAYILISPFRTEPKEGLSKWPADKPLLLIHGRKDRIVPFHHLQIFLEALPPELRDKAIVVQLERGSHNALATSPAEGQKEVSAALEEWIDTATEKESTE